MKTETCQPLAPDDALSATPVVQTVHTELRLGPWKVLISVYEVIEQLLWRYRRQQQRLQLMSLNDSQLKDIGISRADAEHEGSKSFWE